MAPWSKISFPVGTTILPGPILLSGYFPDCEADATLEPVGHRGEIIDGGNGNPDDQGPVAAPADEAWSALVPTVKDGGLTRALDAEPGEIALDLREPNRVSQLNNPPSCYASGDAEGTSQADASGRPKEGRRSDRQVAEGNGRGCDAQDEGRDKTQQAQEGQQEVEPSFAIVAVYPSGVLGLFTRLIERFVESVKAADAERWRPEYVTVRLPNAEKHVGWFSREIEPSFEVVPENLERDATNGESTDIKVASAELFLAPLRHVHWYGKLIYRAYRRCRNNLSPGLVLVDYPPVPKPYHMVIANVLGFAEVCIKRIRESTSRWLHILKYQQRLKGPNR